MRVITLAVMGGMFWAAPAVADSKWPHFSASMSRAALFKQQTRLMDTRMASQYSNSARYQPKTLDDGVIPRYAGNYSGEYMPLARASARKYNVPEDLFLRLIQQESGWNSAAVSVKGAQGLAQLMPDTARLLGVDATNPKDNLDGGARYLRMMYDKFGTWRLALAAYNAGPLAVDANNGIPPYEETRTYVSAILGG